MAIIAMSMLILSPTGDLRDALVGGVELPKEPDEAIIQNEPKSVNQCNKKKKQSHKNEETEKTGALNETIYIFSARILTEAINYRVTEVWPAALPTR